MIAEGNTASSSSAMKLAQPAGPTRGCFQFDNPKDIRPA
jgi:hypothetical protein